MYMYYVVLGYSDLGEGLRQVGEQVVDMFRADGETYRGLRDALFGQFRFIELGVGGSFCRKMLMNFRLKSMII